MHQNNDNDPNKRRKKSIRKEPENRKCARLLDKLLANILAEDRKAAMAEFKISYVTISRYLQGDVANLERGLSLLSFFSGRIAKRKAQLNELGSSDHPE